MDGDGTVPVALQIGPTKNAINLFLKFAASRKVGRQVEFDMSGLLSRECFHEWCRTRTNSRLKRSCVTAFKDAVISLIRQRKSRRTLPPAMAKALVTELRKKRVWPCFDGLVDESGERISVGESGMRFRSPAWAELLNPSDALAGGYAGQGSSAGSCSDAANKVDDRCNLQIWPEQVYPSGHDDLPRETEYNDSSVAMDNLRSSSSCFSEFEHRYFSCDSSGELEGRAESSPCSDATHELDTTPEKCYFSCDSSGELEGRAESSPCSDATDELDTTPEHCYFSCDSSGELEGRAESSPCSDATHELDTTPANHYRIDCDQYLSWDEMLLASLSD
jgi:hypothetical protein